MSEPHNTYASLVDDAHTNLNIARDTALENAYAPDDVGTAMVFYHESVADVKSRLAMAEQQRIANLIALAGLPVSTLSIQAAADVTRMLTPERRMWALEQAMVAMGVPGDPS